MVFYLQKKKKVRYARTLFLLILFIEIDARALLHLGQLEAEGTFSSGFKLLRFFPS